MVLEDHVHRTVALDPNIERLNPQAFSALQDRARREVKETSSALEIGEW